MKQRRTETEQWRNRGRTIKRRGEIKDKTERVREKWENERLEMKRNEAEKGNGEDKEEDQDGDAEFPKGSIHADTLKCIIKLWHSVIPFCDLSKAGNHCSH